ncbi:SusD/RagB family nutrient-binding outer membrane lipoprotein [Prevotella sp. oral taxon 376]|uniref:SusD/RagB family nutrient-binding outer membrane lipoprotein n=1 Tax=Prevotella sp. oral taxon 376 TaxID=712466 RepID=UPI000D1EEF5A|nr:SusD/RagB family nutrient-binding outer membrane lipoprotein [Prevotella sp. oral taxon 376]PTL32293.1 SusD/RagB family nutrient-binding outer membrane lipoprotein [Prevotella sp. oral taxon 376]
MKSYKFRNIFSTAAAVALTMGFTACTGNFDKWNLNPADATEAQRQVDNQAVGSPFSTMEYGVMPVGNNRGGSFQIVDILAGGQFGGYFANLKPAYGVGATHYSHYVLPDGWVDEAYKYAYQDVMQNWNTIKKESEKTGGDKNALALATVVKVFGMSRLTDMYGPIPYSQFGSGSTYVAYDSQEDVYKSFFAELDEAIETLQEFHNQDASAKLLANFDNVYGGNVAQWLKFANTLRLRLALRISYANESLAKAEAQKSINAVDNFMTQKEDAAKIGVSTGKNPFYEVTTDWQDLHMGASIDSYMNGYKDPRISTYFTERNGGCHGVRLGLTNINNTPYINSTSPAIFGEQDPVLWMSAAEGFFLRAEAKVRWNLGSESAKNLYEEGIRTSFAEHSTSGAESYINDGSSKPGDFVDASGQGGDTSARGTITIKWDDGASVEEKLERIITQKWIAIYPDGQEAWSEYRRTGYPKLFPTMNDLSGLSLQNLQIRRLRFPTTEYQNNAGNMPQAVSLLGGADNAKTQLWWDKKSH